MDPKPNLTELVEAQIRCIHNTLKDGTCKNFTPMLLVQWFDPAKNDSGLDLCALCLDFNETEDKHRALNHIGEKYYQDKRAPLGVALASEAWISQQLHTQPRYSDDRKEIILIAAKGIDNSLLFESMPVERTKDGCIKPSPFIRYDHKYEFPLLDHFYRGFFKVIPQMRK